MAIRLICVSLTEDEKRLDAQIDRWVGGWRGGNEGRGEGRKQKGQWYRQDLVAGASHKTAREGLPHAADLGWGGGDVEGFALLHSPGLMDPDASSCHTTSDSTWL